MENTVDSFNEYDGKYEILQNGNGEILIIIAYRSGEIVEPKVIYDGGSEILLYRNNESSLFLTNISSDARQPIQYVNKVNVAEIKNDEVLREYTAPVRLIKNMGDIFN